MMTQIFAESAFELSRHGLAVLPLAGDDGKVPQVKFANWRHPPRGNFILKLSRQFPSANVGVLCGLSGISIVDIDDPSVTDMMINRCGGTPLKTATPRGGVHLWYKNNGERSVNLRASEGLDVDVKAAGGIIVAPPSVRPSGPHKGKPYSLLTGSWDDIGRLPPVKPGSLPTHDEMSANTFQTVSTGHRNKSLYSHLLKQARACDDFDALLDVARTINEGFTPPLTDAEVFKTARSAWKFEETGKNWVGREARAVVLSSELGILGGNGDAALLLMRLRVSHGHRKGEGFYLGNAMATKTFGWAVRRFKNAVDALVKRDFLKITHRGGRGINDPRTARLVLGSGLIN